MRVDVGMLEPIKINFGKCDPSLLERAMPWFIRHWLDQEKLVHLLDNEDIPQNLILKIEVV